jgi:hypothetical protein
VNGEESFVIESRNHWHLLDVRLTPRGGIVKVRESLPPDDVPTLVREAIEQAYPHARIRKGTKVVHWTGISYDVPVQDRAKVSHPLTVTFDGRIMGHKAEGNTSGQSAY